MIERFDVPTVEALLQIDGLARDVAERVRAIIAGDIAPCDASEKCARWVRQCHNEPSEHEQILYACDDLLGGCGVEALAIEDEQHTDCGVRFCPPFSYVNFGDPYITTLARDHENGQWVVVCWGDMLEEYERENKLGSYTEYDKEPERCRDCHGAAFTFDEESGKHGAWICDACNSHHTAAEGAAQTDENEDEPCDA